MSNHVRRISAELLADLELENIPHIEEFEVAVPTSPEGVV